MNKLRLAHISDLHIEDGPRLDELIAVLQAFVIECRKAKPELILVSGDVFHKKSTPPERNVFAEWVRAAADVAPIVIVRGNHDGIDDLEIFGHLRTGNHVFVAQRVNVVALRNADVICVPWFDKAHLVSRLSVDVDSETTTQRTISAARHLLTTLGAQANESKQNSRIPLLCGHLLVAGSEVSTGQVLIGTTVELAAGDLLDVDAAYGALGHIHKTQEWSNGRLAYAGSPIRQNFGEVEAKGFRLVEVESDGNEFRIRNDFVELPARKIELYETDLTGEDAEERLTNIECWPELQCLDGNVRGALVRLRYRIRAKDLHRVDQATLERVLRAAGAHDVKIEAVIQQDIRVRSEQIVIATSTWEKCEAFFEAKGIDPDGETRERLREKLALIESVEVRTEPAAA